MNWARNVHTPPAWAPRAEAPRRTWGAHQQDRTSPFSAGARPHRIRPAPSDRSVTNHGSYQCVHQSAGSLPSVPRCSQRQTNSIAIKAPSILRGPSEIGTAEVPGTGPPRYPEPPRTLSKPGADTGRGAPSLVAPVSLQGDLAGAARLATEGLMPSRPVHLPPCRAIFCRDVRPYLFRRKLSYFHLPGSVCLKGSPPASFHA